MRSKKTYEKALRSARSVMKGKGRKATTALTGLAFLAAPACSSDNGIGVSSTSDNSTAVSSTSHRATSTSQDVIEDILRDMATDTLAPEILAGSDALTRADGSVAAADAAMATGDAPSTATDTMTETGHDAAAAETDVVKTCIETCMQPNGKACTAHDDCNLAEVMGKCAGSGEECAWDCKDESLCEGYQPQGMANFDPETNELQWSAVGCIDGECHDGQQISLAADECCASIWGVEPVLCEGVDSMQAGCMAWGPPAPPAYRGLTLDALLGRLS